MTAGTEKEFTVLLYETNYTVKADRFVIDEGILKFMSGSTQVAAFNRWDGVI